MLQVTGCVGEWTCKGSCTLLDVIQPNLVSLAFGQVSCEHVNFHWIRCLKENIKQIGWHGTAAVFVLASDQRGTAYVSLCCTLSFSRLSVQRQPVVTCWNMMTFEILKHNGAFVKDRQVFLWSQHAANSNSGIEKSEGGWCSRSQQHHDLWINYLLIWKVVSKVITVV